MEAEMVLIILNLGQQEKRNEVHKSIYNKNLKWRRLQYMEQTAVCLIRHTVESEWHRNSKFQREIFLHITETFGVS